MGQYTLSGLAMLGGLGATENDLGAQYSVVAYAGGTENRKAEISPAMNSAGLRVMSWPNPVRDGEVWRYQGKVLTTLPLGKEAVKAAVITALVRNGSIIRSVAVSRLTWPSGGGSGGGGSVVVPPTSDACRARGGVCRDISAQPARANEEVVRGLCTGSNNIVCVVPRSSGGSRPGGGSSSGGGAPNTGGAPAFQPGIPGDMDWGSIALVGGSVLFLGAVVFAVVKKRRARTQMAMANGRRRRRRYGR